MVRPPAVASRPLPVPALPGLPSQHALHLPALQPEGDGLQQGGRVATRQPLPGRWGVTTVTAAEKHRCVRLPVDVSPKLAAGTQVRLHPPPPVHSQRQQSLTFVLLSSSGSGLFPAPGPGLGPHSRPGSCPGLGPQSGPRCVEAAVCVLAVLEADGDSEQSWRTRTQRHLL